MCEFEEWLPESNFQTNTAETGGYLKAISQWVQEIFEQMK
jgi:hypothetical protein